MTDNERATKRAWRVAHREQVRASKRAYYARYRERELAKSNAKHAANRESILEKNRQRYAAERVERRALARARYATDPEHAARVLANNKKYRAASLDEFRERDKRYAKAHQERDRGRFLEKMRRAGQKRRALKMGAFVEAIDATTVFNRDKGVCGICHRKVDPQSRWHIDHVIPLSQGGVHSYDNAQLAHARCNLSKRGTLPTGQLGLFQKAATIVLGGAR